MTSRRSNIHIIALISIIVLLSLTIIAIVIFIIVLLIVSIAFEFFDRSVFFQRSTRFEVAVSPPVNLYFLLTAMSSSPGCKFLTSTLVVVLLSSQLVQSTPFPGCDAGTLANCPSVENCTEFFLTQVSNDQLVTSCRLG